MENEQADRRELADLLSEWRTFKRRVAPASRFALGAVLALTVLAVVIVVWSVLHG